MASIARVYLPTSRRGVDRTQRKECYKPLGEAPHTTRKLTALVDIVRRSTRRQGAHTTDKNRVTRHLSPTVHMVAKCDSGQGIRAVQGA